MDLIMKELEQIPFIGDILIRSPLFILYFLIAVMFLLIINKWMRDYLNFDLFKRIWCLIEQAIVNGPEKQRKKFTDTISKKDYIDWQNEVLATIYGKENLLVLNNKLYPSIIFRSSDKTKAYPFENLCKDGLKEKEIQLFEEKNKLQKEYLKLLGNTIKRPKLEGYALKELTLDDNLNITHVSAKLCNYEQNVITSHILEYELYKTYSDKKVTQMAKENGLKYLHLRNDIHKNRNIEEVLCKGDTRISLIGVQMLVVFKSVNGYKLLIMKRSEDVAVRPGYWQFIPSGGFELFENDANAVNIEKNYDVKLAIFRELLEEVFGEAEYEHNVNGDPVDLIINNPNVKEIISLIEDEKAKFEFLGSVIDLISLRHELSFLMVIDDERFETKKFKSNHEAINLEMLTIDELNKLLESQVCLNPGSAGLLKLARENELFQQRMK